MQIEEENPLLLVKVRCTASAHCLLHVSFCLSSTSQDGTYHSCTSLGVPPLLEPKSWRFEKHSGIAQPQRPAQKPSATLLMSSIPGKERTVREETWQHSSCSGRHKSVRVRHDWKTAQQVNSRACLPVVLWIRFVCRLAG